MHWTAYVVTSSSILQTVGLHLLKFKISPKPHQMIAPMLKVLAWKCTSDYNNGPSTVPRNGDSSTNTVSWIHPWVVTCNVTTHWSVLKRNERVRAHPSWKIPKNSWAGRACTYNAAQCLKNGDSSTTSWIHPRVVTCTLQPIERAEKEQRVRAHPSERYQNSWSWKSLYVQ
jgi:hypothetical protein